MRTMRAMTCLRNAVRALSKLESSTGLDVVILNAVKNLVLHRAVSPFVWG
jgi:hypothetical protein